MDTLGLSTQLKVRQCSRCQGDTEFYCNTCKRDLCLQCKEKHVIDLHTKHHGVVIYREKFKCVPLRATCVRHPDRKYRMFCDQCNYSVCKSCTDHRTHALVDLTTIYQTKRKQHREIIDNIRSETLYNCRVLLAGIQTDIQTCPPQICHHHSQIFTKAEGLKDLIDTAVCDVKKRYRGLLIDRIQQQKKNINRHLTHIQNYEDRYEQSANRAVQFLLFIKTSRVPQIKDTPNLPQHLLLSVSEGFNLEDASQFLRQIPQMQITTRKRQIGIDECVKLTSTPVLHTSVCMTGVSRVLHISRVMPDGVWVRDFSKLILTDTTGDTIHRVTDIATWYGGLYTINSSSELIYIDSDYNMKKLSVGSGNEECTTLLRRPLSWRPQCVYCSPSTGELIVGMLNNYTGKVIRYSSSGQHILTIQDGNTGHTLYNFPHYITENTNGDIIVSDWIHYDRGAVVVTESRGRHRFSYTGPPSGSSLAPHGVCTDALSHILVCDDNTDTVQMIDKDGQFLSLLLTRQHGINKPWGLNYDEKTHLLWVGLRNTNIVSVYRYIQRKYSLTDNPDRDGRITEVPSYEEVQKSGRELEIGEESECEENSEGSSEESDPDKEDTAESGTREDNIEEETAIVKN